MEEKNNNQESLNKNDFLKSNLFLWIIVWLWVIAIIILNTFIFYYLSNKIDIQNDYIIKNSTFCYEKDNDLKDVLEKRVENLEQKNIDIFASTQTINFWMTFFAILLPLMLWFFIYQKWKFEDKAEKELEKMKNLKEKAENIIVRLDESINEEINDKYELVENKLNNKIYEFEKFIINAKKDWNEINIQIDIYKKDTLLKNQKNLFEEWKKYMDNKDYLWAINIYTKLIGLNNNNPLNYRFRWFSFMKVNDYKSAIFDYEKYLELWWNWGDESYTIIRLASLYSLDNNIIKSIEKLEEAYERNYFNDGSNIIMLNYPDFHNIRYTPKFQEFLKKLKEKYPEETSKNS